jgi:flagellar hook-length control protein FliK
MMSDLNMVSAPGPSARPGVASSAAPSEAAPAHGTFASLVDNAAAGGKGEASDIDPDADAPIDPHVVDAASPDANGAQYAITDPLALKELRLLGSAAACKSASGADRNEATVDADKKSDDDDDAESGEIPLEGVLNIDWLLAQPASRLPRTPSNDGVTETRQDASRVGSGSLKGVTQPFARTWTMAASLDSNARTSAATQAESKADDAPVVQPDLGATVDALVAHTAPEVPAEAPKAEATKETAQTQLVKGLAGQVATAPAPPKSTASKLELDVRGAETLAAQQRAATAVQGNTSTALPTNVAAAEVVKPSPAATARLEHAAARLAKVIERSGGLSIEAAGTVPTVQPLDTAAGTRQDGSSAFSSSSHDHGAALPEPVRVAGTSTPVFVIPQAAAAVTAGMSSLHAEAAAAPGARLHDADMLQQFVQTMRVQFRDGIGDAVLRLRPEHLGEVSISLRVENGTVAATVSAEAAAVRQWLETNQASLRQSLSEQGLHLDRFVVQRDPEERQSREDQPSRQQQRRRRTANADTPRFEITV